MYVVLQLGQVLQVLGQVLELVLQVLRLGLGRGRGLLCSSLFSHQIIFVKPRKLRNL
jgi:hypothetical protein